MPSKSEKQKRFFNIAAHDPEFAESHGIKPEVAKEWHEADKRQEQENLEKDSTMKDKK